MVVGASEDRQTTISILELEVAEAYVLVLRARRTLQVAESSFGSLSAHTGDVQHLVDRELVPRSDALAAQLHSPTRRNCACAWQTRSKSRRLGTTGDWESLSDARQNSMIESRRTLHTQVLDAVTLQIGALNNHDNAVLDESLSLLRLARAAGVL